MFKIIESQKMVNSYVLPLGILDYQSTRFLKGVHFIGQCTRWGNLNRIRF